jgi:hypothetical protein
MTISPMCRKGLKRAERAPTIIIGSFRLRRATPQTLTGYIGQLRVYNDDFFFKSVAKIIGKL